MENPVMAAEFEKIAEEVNRKTRRLVGFLREARHPQYADAARRLDEIDRQIKELDNERKEVADLLEKGPFKDLERHATDTVRLVLRFVDDADKVLVEAEKAADVEAESVSYDIPGLLQSITGKISRKAFDILRAEIEAFRIVKKIKRKGRITGKIMPEAVTQDEAYAGFEAALREFCDWLDQENEELEREIERAFD